MAIIGQIAIQILSAKEKSQISNEMEKEIDLLVFKLYDFNFNEVKIIDPEFELSEEEYNALKF